MDMLITDELLISLGFERKRIWNEKQENFTLKYSIEAFDGQIDIISTFCSPGAWSPDRQIEEGSGIDFLIKHCHGSYHVYGGDFHIVSIDLKSELLTMMSCLKIEH